MSTSPRSWASERVGVTHVGAGRLQAAEAGSRRTQFSGVHWRSRAQHGSLEQDQVADVERCGRADASRGAWRTCTTQRHTRVDHRVQRPTGRRASESTRGRPRRKTRLRGDGHHTHAPSRRWVWRVIATTCTLSTTAGNSFRSRVKGATVAPGACRSRVAAAGPEKRATHTDSATQCVRSRSSGRAARRPYHGQGPTRPHTSSCRRACRPPQSPLAHPTHGTCR